MCDDDTSTTKRWTPLGPPDGFDISDASVVVSWVLAIRGSRGGRREGELRE